MTIRTVSAEERAIRGREFQAQRIREAAEKSNEKWREKEMEKREEILSRLIELSKACHDGKVNWIKEDAIKRDSILVLRDVLKTFGSIKGAKQATYEAMYGSRYSSPPVVGSIVKQTERSSTETSEYVPEDTKQLEELRHASGKTVKNGSRNRKPAKQKTVDELWNEVRVKSRKLGHIVSGSEIFKDEEMSSVPTYKKFLGADWQAVLAAELGFSREAKGEQKSITKKADARKSATKSAKKKVGKSSKVNSRKTPAAGPKTIEIEETPDAPIMTESSNEVEIPIKLIIPKGIKGTIQLTLEF